MSLINKMLQDLDARGGPNGAARLHSLPIASRRSPHLVMKLLGAAGILAVAGAAGYAGWKALRKVPEPAKPSVTMLTAQPAPAVKPAPAAAKAAAPVASQVAAAEAEPENQADDKLPGVAPAEAAAPEPAAAAPRLADNADEAPAARPASVADKPAGEKPAAAKPGRTVTGGKAAVAAAPIREMSPQQKAEAEYKRASNALTEGRIGEAVAALERALQEEPRHDAARQTLASLLIEARRSDEAIRVMQAGLVLDPNQPNMAMLLARLQIERGGPGLETLQRTLPYAEGNPEYHAFMAGALQREQRHREAIEHYQIAVKMAPQNGVWLMGMGLSLGAEKRNPEALEAFRRAKSAGTLTPELVAFVDRKIAQLGR